MQHGHQRVGLVRVVGVGNGGAAARQGVLQPGNPVGGQKRGVAGGHGQPLVGQTDRAAWMPARGPGMSGSRSGSTGQPSRR